MRDLAQEEQRTLAARRAAGAVLRAARSRGVPLRAFSPELKLKPLRAELAIEALLAGAGACFELEPAEVAALLAPALSAWRTAVGCSDPILVPENASREPALAPLPMPSWCAHLLDAGLLRLVDGPRREGGLVVQRAILLAMRDPASSEVECFALTFAGSVGAVSPHVHLAISPPFLGDGWRGPIWLRAAASREGPRIPLWLGPPSNPSSPAPEGARGLSVATWPLAIEEAGAQHGVAPLDGRAGRARIPRWAVLRLLEGDEPQALWDLRACCARLHGEHPRGPGGAAQASLRIALDVGNMITSILEEEAADSGPLGGKLLGGGAVRSGFRLLAGERETAHRFGCGETLSAGKSLLPTALCAAGPEALAGVLSGELGAEQCWLPQDGEGPGAALYVDRFKNPSLALQSEWFAAGLEAPAAAEHSRRLLQVFGLLVGRALAVAHASPLVAAAGGGWVQRLPWLARVESLLTFASPAFATGGDEAARERLEAAGAALREGLQAAWRSSSTRLISRRTAAAARAREHGERSPAGERFPIEVIGDFGGAELRLLVRLPQREGRPPLAISGSSASYLIGGERLLDAAALASASLSTAPSREAFRANARRLRRAAGFGDRLPSASHEATAIRETLARWTVELVRRQLAGTLRRAAPDAFGLRGAGARLRLFGAGWKLLALDAPEESREEEIPRVLERALADAPLEGVPFSIERESPQGLCAGALRAEREAPAEPAHPELLGIDTTSGLRWFARAADFAEPAWPSGDDAWWRAFTRGTQGALLRPDQWFVRDEMFGNGLAGGLLAFAPRRSLLKQWLDTCGPSLFALQVREHMKQASLANTAARST